MKRILTIILCILLVFGITSCASKTQDEQSTQNNSNIKEDENVNIDSKSAVLYFSATGTTKEVAQKISEVTNSDIIEIIPKERYTEKDLDYNNECRANIEQNDESARPAIKNEINIDNYDVIYLGYPIWWGTIPKIILTLLDNYNFEGKTVIPFCTSGSTGIEQSINDLKSYNSNINFVNGKRFSSSATIDEIKSWTNSFLVTEGEKMYIKVNNEVLTVSLNNNSSTQALIEKLKEKDLTIEMDDYANFEKVGSLGFSIPTNDEQITTTFGDVILYQGDKITIYYDTNSWNFTKLGHIDNITQNELKNILGKDNVKVTFSLHK